MLFVSFIIDYLFKRFRLSDAASSEFDMFLNEYDQLFPFVKINKVILMFLLV